MFERDVQADLDRYLSGAIEEPEFLKLTRPWPRYATDYRPLVELARAHGWPVVAANVPRRHAAAVASGGRAALDALAPADRGTAAQDLECPRDAYFDRFAKAMGGHTGKPGAADAGAPPLDDANMDRYFWSQCVKDETMAESIARAVERRAGKGPVVHLSGAFHSDFGTGVVERTRRRLPGRRIATLTILPVTDLDAVAPSGDDLQRADFLVFTTR
jgi:uncharacterized iron-regulated protein